MIDENNSAEAIQPQLTSRETEILPYLADGYSNKQIASEMKVTEYTIKSHVTNIMRKLRASNRAQAVALALRQGLLMQDKAKMHVPVDTEKKDKPVIDSDFSAKGHGPVAKTKPGSFSSFLRFRQLLKKQRAGRSGLRRSDRGYENPLRQGLQTEDHHSLKDYDGATSYQASHNHKIGDIMSSAKYRLASLREGMASPAQRKRWPLYLGLLVSFVVVLSVLSNDKQ